MSRSLFKLSSEDRLAPKSDAYGQLFISYQMVFPDNTRIGFAQVLQTLKVIEKESSRPVRRGSDVWGQVAISSQMEFFSGAEIDLLCCRLSTSLLESVETGESGIGYTKSSEAVSFQNKIEFFAPWCAGKILFLCFSRLSGHVTLWTFS